MTIIESDLVFRSKLTTINNLTEDFINDLDDKFYPILQICQKEAGVIDDASGLSELLRLTLQEMRKQTSDLHEQILDLGKEWPADDTYRAIKDGLQEKERDEEITAKIRATIQMLQDKTPKTEPEPPEARTL